MHGRSDCIGCSIYSGKSCSESYGAGDASHCFAGTGGGMLGGIHSDQTGYGCLDWENPKNSTCRECSVFDMGCFLVYKIIGGEFPDSVGVRKTFLKICEKCVALCSAKLSYNSIERQRWILLEKTRGD